MQDTLSKWDSYIFCPISDEIEKSLCNVYEIDIY